VTRSLINGSKFVYSVFLKVKFVITEPRVGIGAVVARWERFHLNPFPSVKELEGLATVVGVEVQRLREMLPPQGVGMKCEPIRLCGACYAELPSHRMEWQFKSTAGCQRHQLRLLSKCPRCGARFKIPALWEDGCCDNEALLRSADRFGNGHFHFRK